jgi:hypothetical protein
MNTGKAENYMQATRAKLSVHHSKQSDYSKLRIKYGKSTGEKESCGGLFRVHLLRGVEVE